MINLYRIYIQFYFCCLVSNILILILYICNCSFLWFVEIQFYWCWLLLSLLNLIFIQVIGTSLPENEVFPTWDEQVHNGLPTDKSNKIRRFALRLSEIIPCLALEAFSPLFYFFEFPLSSPFRGLLTLQGTKRRTSTLRGPILTTFPNPTGIT